jgi:hypothetical protein
MTDSKPKLDTLDKKTEYRRERIRLLCWELLEQNPKGKELITHLIEEYIVNTQVVRLDIQNPAEYAAMREGQNEMIRILHNLAVNFNKETQTVTTYSGDPVPKQS